MKGNMKYTYQITKADKSNELLSAMSFKKLLKQLAIKYPNQLIWVSYKNKKNNLLNKIVFNGMIKQ